MSQSGPNQHLSVLDHVGPFYTLLDHSGTLLEKLGKSCFQRLKTMMMMMMMGGWDTCVPTLGTHVSQPPIIIISGMCPNPADDQLPMAENS